MNGLYEIIYLLLQLKISHVLSDINIMTNNNFKNYVKKNKSENIRVIKRMQLAIFRKIEMHIKFLMSLIIIY